MEKETTALAVLNDARQYGMVFVESGFFEDTKAEAQAIVKILAGKEVGLQPIESMTGIHIVKGKVTFGSNVMAAAVKRHPCYDYKIKEHTNKKCVIEFFEIIYDLKDRKPSKELIYTSEFTIEDAKMAGLVKQFSPWEKHPKNMCFSRALSNGVRFSCPDVFGSNPVYTPEEMGAEVDEDGEMINITPHHNSVEEDGEPVVMETKPKAKPKAKKDELVRQCPCGNAIPMDSESGKCAQCITKDDEVQDAEFSDVPDDVPDEVLDEVPDEVPDENEPEPEDPDDDKDAMLEFVKKLKAENVVSADMTPREGFNAILDAGFPHYMVPCNELTEEFCENYRTDNLKRFQIPESACKAIVKRATGKNLKLVEKSCECKVGSCENKLTEPEDKERDGYCQQHWQESLN